MHRFFWIATASLAISACQNAPQQQQVDGAWVRLAAVKGNPAAAYFALKGGSTPDRLMGVASPLAVRAELHESKSEKGVMRMIPLKAGLDLPARTDVTFAPGGKHVMLFDVSPRVTIGRKMPLSLSFASGLVLSVEADVMGPDADEPHQH